LASFSGLLLTVRNSSNEMTFFRYSALQTYKKFINLPIIYEKYQKTLNEITSKSGNSKKFQYESKNIFMRSLKRVQILSQVKTDRNILIDVEIRDMLQAKSVLNRFEVSMVLISPSIGFLEIVYSPCATHTLGQLWITANMLRALLST
jgi:hypothetical protein